MKLTRRVRRIRPTGPPPGPPGRSPPPGRRGEPPPGVTRPGCQFRAPVGQSRPHGEQLDFERSDGLGPTQSGDRDGHESVTESEPTVSDRQWPGPGRVRAAVASRTAESRGPPAARGCCAGPPRSSHVPGLGLGLGPVGCHSAARRPAGPARDPALSSGWAAAPVTAARGRITEAGALSG